MRRKSRGRESSKRRGGMVTKGLGVRVEPDTERGWELKV